MARSKPFGFAMDWRHAFHFIKRGLRLGLRVWDFILLARLQPMLCAQRSPGSLVSILRQAAF
jgi:hypothetical protein